MPSFTPPARRCSPHSPCCTRASGKDSVCRRLQTLYRDFGKNAIGCPSQGGEIHSQLGCSSIPMPIDPIPHCHSLYTCTYLGLAGRWTRCRPAVRCVAQRRSVASTSGARTTTQMICKYMYTVQLSGYSVSSLQSIQPTRQSRRQGKPSCLASVLSHALWFDAAETTIRMYWWVVARTGLALGATQGQRRRLSVPGRRTGWARRSRRCQHLHPGHHRRHLRRPCPGARRLRANKVSRVFLGQITAARTRRRLGSRTAGTTRGC